MRFAQDCSSGAKDVESGQDFSCNVPLGHTQGFAGQADPQHITILHGREQAGSHSVDMDSGEPQHTSWQQNLISGTCRSTAPGVGSGPGVGRFSTHWNTRSQDLYLSKK